MPITGLPEIRDRSLLLRPIRAADLAPWLGYLQLPMVEQFSSWRPRSIEDLAEFVWPSAERPPSAQLRFAITRRSTDRLLGTIGFHSLQPSHQCAELAFDLDPRQWGRGIATLAGQAVLHWAHGPAQLVRVQATVLCANLRSIALLQRCGFQREGLLRAYRRVGQGHGDFWMYSHLRDDLDPGARAEH